MLSVASSDNDRTKHGASAGNRDLVLRLARIRQVMDRVDRNHERPTETDRILAVIGYDWSVETLLKTVILMYDAGFPFKDTSVGTLWQEANKRTKDDPACMREMPPSAGVKRVRSIRNAVQHDGACPSRDETDECRQAAISLIRETVETVWGMDFSEITAAELIRNKDVRIELWQSEWDARKPGADAPLRAAQRARRVLENVLRRIMPCAAGPDIGGPDYDADSPEMRRVKLAIGDMQRGFLLHALGLDYPDYLRISRLTGQFAFLPGCPNGAYEHAAKPISANDARFVIEYCIDAVLSIEDTVSDLQYPFGLDPDGIVDGRDMITAWRPAQPEHVRGTDKFFYAGHDSSEEDIQEDYSQIPPDYDGNTEA